MSAMALLPYAFLKFSIRKSLRMTAFAFGVRLATIFVLSSLDR